MSVFRLACLALLAGCSGASGGGALELRCDQDTRKDTYVANLEKAGTGAKFRFRLAAATPAPPEKGVNEWTVEVLDSGGKPLPGLQLSGTSSMPDHGHAPVTRMATENAPGRYLLRPDLFMSGLWVVTVTATRGSDVDHTSFKFCIEG